MYRLFLFGAPQLERDGRVVEIPRRKTTALLAYLAVTGKAHTREALATLFWPEHDQSSALANLRRELSRLKQVLGGEGLRADRSQASLNQSAQIWVDAIVFQQKIHLGHAHGQNDLCQECALRLQEGIELYRGRFMAGFNLPDSPEFDEWQFFVAEEMRQGLVGALQKLIEWHIQLGELEQSIACARKWLAQDYFHEPAHRMLMQLYAWSGQRAAALRQFQECVRILKQELDVEPEDETLELFEVIKARQLRPLEGLALVSASALEADFSDLEARFAHYDSLVSQAMDLRVETNGLDDGQASQEVYLDAQVRSQPPKPNIPLKQQIRFCRSRDGVTLAYATVGQGPVLVKAANWLSHLEFDWESPVWKHWLVGLAQKHTLVRYDERGCGLSDWDVADMSFEAWVRDLEAVVDAVGAERFPLLGISQGGAIAIAYAVRHPEKVSRLILYGSYARGKLMRDPTPEQIEEINVFGQLIRLGWGKEHPAFRQVFSTLFLPEGTAEQIQAFNELQRLTSTPENAARIVQGFNTIDVRDLATQVRAPTLVLHARGDLRIPLAEGQLLASLIPGARLAILESKNHILLESEPAWRRFLFEVEYFLASQDG
jgi:DNA-binding SARP family transcriptional activator/pimeloyl-ACP methyl ester carboxylesterase